MIDAIAAPWMRTYSILAEGERPLLDPSWCYSGTYKLPDFPSTAPKRSVKVKIVKVKDIPVKESLKGSLSSYGKIRAIPRGM